MTIGSLSASSLFAARIFNVATARADRLTRHLAADTRVLSAADDPSAIGRIESLRSRISETRILAGLAPAASATLKGVDSELTSLRSVATSAVSTEDLRALVASVRDAVRTQTSGGTQLLAGDPAGRVVTTTTTPATSGYVQGEALAASVTISATRVNLLGQGRADFTVSVDGTDHAVAINAGTYTQAELQSAVQSALDAKAPGAATVTLESGALRFTSASTGASSQVAVSGPAATELGFAAATSVAGTDSSTTTTTGPAPALTLNFAGRSVTFANLDQIATDLEAALDGGDTAATEAVRTRLVEAIDSTRSNVAFAATRLDADVAAHGRRNEVLSVELGNITKLDRSEATVDLLKAQLQVEQAGWAMQQVRDMHAARTRVLFESFSQ